MRSKKYFYIAWTLIIYWTLLFGYDIWCIQLNAGQRRWGWMLFSIALAFIPIVWGIPHANRIRMRELQREETRDWIEMFGNEGEMPYIKRPTKVFRCAQCGTLSTNQFDVLMRYCGECRKYEELT